MKKSELESKYIKNKARENLKSYQKTNMFFAVNYI